MSLVATVGEEAIPLLASATAEVGTVYATLAAGATPFFQTAVTLLVANIDFYQNPTTQRAEPVEGFEGLVLYGMTRELWIALCLLLVFGSSELGAEEDLVDFLRDNFSGVELQSIVYNETGVSSASSAVANTVRRYIARAQGRRIQHPEELLSIPHTFENETKDPRLFIEASVQEAFRERVRAKEEKQELERVEWLAALRSTPMEPESTPPPPPSSTASGLSSALQVVQHTGPRVLGSDLSTALSRALGSASTIYIYLYAASSVRTLLNTQASWQEIQGIAARRVSDFTSRTNLQLPDSVRSGLFSGTSASAFEREIQKAISRELEGVGYNPAEIVQQIEQLQHAVIEEAVEEMLLDDALDDDLFFDAAEYVPPEEDVFYDAIEYEGAGPLPGLNPLERQIVRGEVANRPAYVRLLYAPAVEAVLDAERVQAGNAILAGEGLEVDNLELEVPQVALQDHPRAALRRLARLNSRHLRHFANRWRTWTNEQIAAWLRDPRTVAAWSGLENLLYLLSASDVFAFARLSALLASLGYAVSVWDSDAVVSRNNIRPDPVLDRLQPDYEPPEQYDPPNYNDPRDAEDEDEGQNNLPHFKLPKVKTVHSYTFCDPDNTLGENYYKFKDYDHKDECMMKQLWWDTLVFYLGFRWYKLRGPPWVLMKSLFACSYKPFGQTIVKNLATIRAVYTPPRKPAVLYHLVEKTKEVSVSKGMDAYDSLDEMRDQLKWLPVFWFTKARTTTVHYYELVDAQGNAVDMKNFIYAPNYIPRPVGILTPGTDSQTPGTDEKPERLTPRQIGVLTLDDDFPAGKLSAVPKEKLLYWQALQRAKYFFVYPQSAVLQQLLDVTAGYCRDVQNLLNQRVLAYTFKHFTNEFNRWCKEHLSNEKFLAAKRRMTVEGSYWLYYYAWLHAEENVPLEDIFSSWLFLLLVGWYGHNSGPRKPLPPPDRPKQPTPSPTIDIVPNPKQPVIIIPSMKTRDHPENVLPVNCRIIKRQKI